MPAAFRRWSRRLAVLLLSLMMASLARADGLVELDVSLDPASRAEILDALANFAGAVVLVSHDPGAVESLNPERVLIMPDGTEDHWTKDYLDLIELA